MSVCPVGQPVQVTDDAAGNHLCLSGEQRQGQGMTAAGPLTSQGSEVFRQRWLVASGLVVLPQATLVPAPEDLPEVNPSHTESSVWPSVEGQLVGWLLLYLSDDPLV